MKQWKYIDDTNSLYSISNEGDVLSHRKGILLVGDLNTKGYRRVSIFTSTGVRKRYTVHRLVATYFIPNPNNKPQVNHIDGCKLNNHFNNLEWVTNTENYKHAVGLGKNQFDIGSKHRNSKITEKEAQEIKYSNLTIKQLEKIYNLKSGAIGNIKRGKTWKHV